MILMSHMMVITSHMLVPIITLIGTLNFVMVGTLNFYLFKFNTYKKLDNTTITCDDNYIIFDSNN